jgi:hypothetical protein
MRTFIVVMAVALLALGFAADAAGRHGHRGSGQQKAANKPKVDEKAYNNALSTLPDQKYDPWKSMR